MGWKRALRFVARTGVFALIATLVTACQSIPDISEWKKATSDVSSAVAEGFQGSVSANAGIARRLEGDTAYADAAKRYSSVGSAVSARADQYEKLFGALVDYSSSLAAIAKAADNSTQAVASVAGSLNSLISTFGAAPLAGATFELGKLLAGELIKVKAAADFADAVQKADPAIDRVAQLLSDDLADLQKIVGATKEEAIRQSFELGNSRQLDYRRALVRRRSDLFASIRNAVAPAGDRPTNSLATATDASELGRLDQLLKDADTWYVPWKAELDKALAARAKTEELVVQTQRAVKAWRDSHASLATAARERRAPDSGRLAALAIRIRDLVEDIKKGK
jgi:hypothetical protein